MSTRYSMRLRARGNASVGSSDNDAASSAAASDSRTALGNISNREGNDDDSEIKTIKTRRGRSTQSKATESDPSEADADDQPQPVAARRASSRTRRAPPKLTVTATDKATTTKAAAAAAAKKPAAKKKAAPAKKGAAAKKVGAKRKSSDGTDAKTGAGRTAKRTKKSDTSAATEAKAAAGRKRAASRPAVRKKKVAVTPMREVTVDILAAPGDNHVVPQDFGLQRDSFEEGHTFTYGIAHYDARDRSDPLRCKDYVTDMFQHLYHAETESHPKPYMDTQEDITPKMRAILVDWLVEVHMKFRLVPETLYLCVHILDRYCAIAHVERSKLQLVGVTALFLACKHEEIYPPEVRDCVYITDRAYDRQEVLDMEQTILGVLDWKVSLPTAYPFLDRFLSLTNASEMTRHAAHYYMERTLQEHDLLEYRPSVVCASVVILALNNPDIRLHEEEYERELPGLPKLLMEYTGFDQDNLMACMTIVAAKVCEPAICASRRHLTAVRKKYEHTKYARVSSTLEDPSVQYVIENMSLDE